MTRRSTTARTTKFRATAAVRAAAAAVWVTSSGCVVGPADPATIDFEGTCAAEWPVDECAGDPTTCTSEGEERHYAEGLIEVFQETSGWTDAQMADQFSLRAVDWRDAQQSSHAYVTTTLRLDWATFLDEQRYASTTHQAEPSVGDPSYDQVAAAWRGDLEGKVILAADATFALSISEIEDAIADCDAAEGVVLDRSGWCSPYFGWQSEHFEALLRFEFKSERVNNEWVTLDADVLEGDVDCRREQVDKPFEG